MSSRGSTQPGDLILVASEGAVFAAGRRLTGNRFDHIAVVVGEGQTVNIDKPRARLLPQDRLLKPAYQPVVLRPAWKSAEDQQRFVEWIEGLVGLRYDTARTLSLLGRLLIKRGLRLQLPLRRPSPGQPCWICTDAVLLGLEQHARGFTELDDLPLDWLRLNCGTTNDFLVINEKRPDLLARVSLSCR